MAVGMKDVAKRCDVSIKTVSNVINNAPNIGPATRARVLEAIRELNYVPNLQARSLVVRKSAPKSHLGYRIGCIFPEGQSVYTNSYYSSIFKGIEEELAVQNAQLAFSIAVDELEKHPLKLNCLLSSENTDALISFPGPDNVIFDRISALPFVLMSGPTGYESVNIEKSGGVAEIIEHLYKLGHRRIVYVGDLKDERFHAFRFELSRRELSVRPEDYLECSFGLESGKSAGLALLKQKTLPTAIFAASDYTAIGVMHTLLAHGIKIPQDISIAGYDNLSESTIIYPTLTTVDPNKEGIGRLAVRTVLDRIRHPKREPSIHTLGSQLVIRESTGGASRK